MTELYVEYLFDGRRIHSGQIVTIKDGWISGVRPAMRGAQSLLSGILAPGFVDLQVNGGGGVMLNDGPCCERLAQMIAAHAGLGATSILPTLITDRPEVTQAAIEAVAKAIETSQPSVAGLHLEGPHLALARKGAHRADFIRPMEAADLDMLLAAKTRLPVLKITLATEAATPEQIAELTRAGCLVSLGHSDASFEDVTAAVKAGASCVTHLFNAMSQMTSRAPGLVGAALDNPEISMGLIADGYHVSPPMIRLALRANQGPGRPFLVSDAMATAGSTITKFDLQGRVISRAVDKLTLEDGTLAGAHLPLARAIKNLVSWGAADLETSLAMATRIPADVIGRADIGRIEKGARADLVLLNREDLSLKKVWRGGQPIALSPK